LLARWLLTVRLKHAAADTANGLGSRTTPIPVALIEFKDRA
jgi:hypothetical protein